MKTLQTAEFNSELIQVRYNKKLLNVTPKRLPLTIFSSNPHVFYMRVLYIKSVINVTDKYQVGEALS